MDLPLLTTTSSNLVLEMKAVTLNFAKASGAEFNGVFDLNFSLAEGTILGLIGPSGCGKTTTMRLLTGVYRPQRGVVRVFNKDPATFTKTDKALIGYLPQQVILYPHLSAEENLHFMGGIYGMDSGERRARIDALLDFVELSEARRRLVRQLSGGMQRRLMLAGALLHEPRLIFADEPTAGIDPILRTRIWQNFHQLRNQGRTLVVTTQYVGEAAYCDLVAVMRAGRLVSLDTPEGLRLQALQGEMLYLLVDAAVVFDVMALLARLPQVRKVEQVDGQPGGIYVFVEDAVKALPTLLNVLHEEAAAEPIKAEPYMPPFDEVFVRLIQHTEEK